MKPVIVIGPYESDNMVITDVQIVDTQSGAIFKHSLMLTNQPETFPLVAVFVTSSAGITPMSYTGYAAWDYWRQFVRTLQQPYMTDAREAWDVYNEVNNLNGNEDQSEIPWTEAMEPLNSED